MSAETKGLSSSPYAGGIDNASSDLTDKFGTITPVTPDAIARAQRVVAGHLGDVDSAREVLDMLGIGGAA